MTYNSLQHIFTSMIGFVTWPPLQHLGIYIYVAIRKSWPSDKANHTYENII